MSKERRRGESLFRRCIRGMDFISRRLLGIAEFDSSEDCLLRIGTLRVDRAIDLPDGAHLRPGDAALELHLWNEHLALQTGNVDLRWAATTRRRFERSLVRLAGYVAQNPELGDVRALMMKPAFTSHQRRKNPRRLPNLLGGGWVMVPTRPGLILRLHAVIDDAWLWLLGRAFGAFDVKEHSFLRHRQEFWISRESFLAHYAIAKPAAIRREEEAARS